MAFSDVRADAILNQEYRTGTVYLALYTTNPTATDTGTEVSGGGYARKAIPFAAPANDGGKRTIKNSAEIQFDVASADWGIVTHVGIRTAATGGTLISFVALQTPRTILSGDRLVFLMDNGIIRLR